MTTNDLITHLTALVAADPSVGELPAYAYEAMNDYIILTGDWVRVEPSVSWRCERALVLGG